MINDNDEKNLLVYTSEMGRTIEHLNSLVDEIISDDKVKLNGVTSGIFHQIGYLTSTFNNFNTIMLNYKNNNSNGKRRAAIGFNGDNE